MKQAGQVLRHYCEDPLKNLRQVALLRPLRDNPTTRLSQPESKPHPTLKAACLSIVQLCGQNEFWCHAYAGHDFDGAL